jgi:hypothetical protein
MRLRTGNTKRKVQFVVRRSCLLAEHFMFHQQFGVGGQNHCHNSSGTIVWFERATTLHRKRNTFVCMEEGSTMRSLTLHHSPIQQQDVPP